MVSQAVFAMILVDVALALLLGVNCAKSRILIYIRRSRLVQSLNATVEVHEWLTHSARQVLHIPNFLKLFDFLGSQLLLGCVPRL